MNKLTIAAALAMTGLVACTDKDSSDSAAATTGGTTATGTTATGTTGPADPTFTTDWGDTAFTITIAGGPGAYWFGWAQNTANDPWTGEDCVYGYTTGAGDTLAYCHDAGDTGTTLTYGGDPNNLAAGTTVWSAPLEAEATYYVESDTEFGGDGSCWVWGSDVTYYDGLGCTVL
ncbi:MAG: hypothetical protein VX265_11980 [Myxococcota bacterium]|nr:hypothetical protein [Myxococcota bacterium]